MGKTDHKCLYCGKKLYYKSHTEYENTGKWRPPNRCYACPRPMYTEAPKRKFKATDDPEVFKCEECGEETIGEKVRRVKSRKRCFKKPGPYGDGFFCSLSCGYSFGVACGNSGMRIKK